MLKPKEVEEDVEDKLEIVEVEEGTEPEVIKVSKKDYDEMVSKAGRASFLEEEVKKPKPEVIVDRSRSNPPPQVSQEKSENWEDFQKRINKDLFGENPTAALSEYFEKVSAPILNDTLELSGKQAKKLLELDPSTGEKFKRYKGEVEDFVTGLSAAQQRNPRVWEYAYNEVLKTKQEDIVREEVDRQVVEKLKALGIEVGEDGKLVAEKGKTKTPFFQESTSTVGAPEKKKVFMTRGEKEKLEREADRLGIPIEHYLRKVGKI